MYLKKEVIEEILLEYPELKYSGLAFRILTFHDDIESMINNDICFSSDPLSCYECGDYSKDFINFFSADVVGIDINKAYSFFHIDSDFMNEKEIVVISVENSKLLYKGELWGFEKYLRQKY